MRFQLFICMALGLFLSSLQNPAKATPITSYNISGGVLQGVDIIFNGTLLNVTFTDGRCDDIFAGCDEQSDFYWQDKDSAEAASQLLFDSILVDSSLGQFDTTPNLTFGCHELSIPFCSVYTPFFSSSGAIEAWRASNSSSINDFPPNLETVSASTSTSGNLNTWALWSIVEVPAPSSLLLLLIASLFIVQTFLFRHPSY